MNNTLKLLCMGTALFSFSSLQAKEEEERTISDNPVLVDPASTITHLSQKMTPLGAKAIEDIGAFLERFPIEDYKTVNLAMLEAETAFSILIKDGGVVQITEDQFNKAIELDCQKFHSDISLTLWLLFSGVEPTIGTLEFAINKLSKGDSLKSEICFIDIMGRLFANYAEGASYDESKLKQLLKDDMTGVSWRILHWAMDHARQDLLIKFLGAGAHPTGGNLIWAAKLDLYNNNTPLTKILLRYGAEPSESVIETVRNNRHSSKVIELLQQSYNEYQRLETLKKYGVAPAA